jgi:hypothetical protein
VFAESGAYIFGRRSYEIAGGRGGRLLHPTELATSAGIVPVTENDILRTVAH